jgi:hypothetical protein
MTKAEKAFVAAAATLTRAGLDHYEVEITNPDELGISDPRMLEVFRLARIGLAARDAEPVAWRYALVINGEEVLVECSKVNWDTTYQPF